MQNSVNVPSAQGPILAETPTEEPSKVVQFFQRWLLYRLPASFVWVWLLTIYSWIELPVDPTLIAYSALSFPIVLVGFFVTGRWSRAFSYPFYFLFFPFVIVVMPVAFGIRIVTGSQAARWASRSFLDFLVFLRSFKFILILCAINIGFWFSVWYSNGDNRPILTLSAHIITYLLFLQSFRWAANPYKPVIAGLDWLATSGSKLVYKLLIEPNLKKKLQDRSSAYAACQQFELGITKLYDRQFPLTHGLTSITHGGLSAIFIVVFFSMYLITALSFAVSLMVMEQGWRKLITGLADNPAFPDYFYFTFLSQATAVPDGVDPVGHAGQLWIAWMITTGLLLLTGLITLFTSAAGTYIESSLREVDELFAAMNRTLRSWRYELSQVPILDDDQKSALTR